MINFRIKVNLSTVTNFGSGYYSLTLPFAPIDDYVFRDGGLHDLTANAHYQIYGDADASSTSLSLMYHSGAKDIWMDHNSPLALTTQDYFYVSGTYQVN